MQLQHMTKTTSMIGRSDIRLVEECCRGDENSWTELIRRYGPLIYGIARRYRLSPEDSVDVYGQVCKILLENLSRLKSGEKLPGYIATTTQRSCMAVVRNNQRRLRLANEVHHEVASDRMAQTSDDLIRDSLRAFMVQRALELMGGRCQKLLWHLFFDPDQPEYEQVSKLIGMPVASIGPTRIRCLEKFRRLLAEMGFDE